MLKLYDSPLSGNCHKVRMLLSMLEIDYQTVPVDIPSGQNRQPAYLAVNPLGRVPVVDDDGVVIRDSQAILIYLARKTGAEDWYPGDAAGQVQEA